MSGAPKSEWNRLYEESVRREDELQEPEPWWSANRIHGWLLLAAVPAVVVGLAFRAMGFEAKWPAIAVFMAVLAACVAFGARRHRLGRKRDCEASLRRYLDAAPPTNEPGRS